MGHAHQDLGQKGIVNAMRSSISSKKQIVLIMMIFIIPFTLFLTAYNFMTVNILNSRIAQTNRDRVKFYQSYLEEDLHSIENFMANLVANDSSYGRLRYELTPLDAHLYTYSIMQKYRDIMSAKRIIGGLFIYTTQNDLYRKVFNYNLPSDVREEAEKYLKKIIFEEEDLGLKGWFPSKIGNQYYLFRILGGNGTFSICMVDFNLIAMPGNQNEENYGFLFYSSHDGLPLTSVDKIQKNEITLRNDGSAYYITGNSPKYLIVQSFSDYSHINLVYAMAYYGLLMDPMNLSLLVASGVFILLLLICSYLLKRYFFTPLNHLVETMDHIKNGNIDAKMNPNSRIEEFQQVSGTFNEMIEQIKQLKIVAYEQTLEAQQAKLQFLQIQIRPHFFLNCLKNLYGMAQAENYKLIQEMILILSDYLRSMFTDSPVVVPLSTELHNVETYIMLQQMSIASPLMCTIDVDEALRAFQIPPLSVLTFVENSIKHGMIPQKPLKIQIKVKLLKNDDEEYVNITIMDNGTGLSEEMLDILNKDNDLQTPTQHVGIMNVKRRFALIYQNKVIFMFRKSNGSLVEIFIPYRKESGN